MEVRCLARREGAGTKKGVRASWESEVLAGRGVNEGVWGSGHEGEHLLGFMPPCSNCRSHAVLGWPWRCHYCSHTVPEAPLLRLCSLGLAPEALLRSLSPSAASSHCNLTCCQGRGRAPVTAQGKRGRAELPPHMRMKIGSHAVGCQPLV